MDRVWDKVVTGNISKVMTNLTRELLFAHREKFTSFDQVSQVLQVSYVVTSLCLTGPSGPICNWIESSL